VLPLLQTLHTKVDRTVVDALFDWWEPQGRGVLELHELDAKLNDDGSGNKSKRQSHKGPSNMLGGELFRDANRSVQEQLRDALVANSMRVIDLFREWDEDGNGMVDKGEFRKAMPMLGLHATREHIDALFDTFDSDGSGEIGFKELNRLLRRDVKAEAKKRETKVVARIEVADISKLRRDSALAMMPMANMTVKGAEDPFAPVDAEGGVAKDSPKESSSRKTASWAGNLVAIEEDETLATVKSQRPLRKATSLPASVTSASAAQKSDSAVAAAKDETAAEPVAPPEDAEATLDALIEGSEDGAAE